MHLGTSAAILAVTKEKEIVLTREYRHGLGRIAFSLPGGTAREGESPDACARRELIEETGYRAKRWVLLTKYFASPGFLGEWMQIYLARDIREGNAAPEDDESIEVFRLTLSQALGLVAANKIHDGKTLIGLMLYDRIRRTGHL